MKLNENIQRAIVASANLAPSVHNTQPALWRFEADGAISILADRRRFLAIGDPTGRDAALSCGAAIEGTVMALADLGLDAVAIEDHWEKQSLHDQLILVARIVTRRGDVASCLAPFVAARFTWRGQFRAASTAMKRELELWSQAREDITLAVEEREISELADLNDQVSLQFFRNDLYRGELLGWMRLLRGHPAYHKDGLNLDALQFSAIEGIGGELLLGKLWPVVDTLRLSRPLVSEKGKTLSSTAIVLFHRPAQESPVTIGREFYRMWLELTRLGFHAWPMSAIADDSGASALCGSLFGIPAGRRLVNLLRVGIAPRSVARARRPIENLIVPA